MKDNPKIKKIKKITIISQEETESKIKLKLFISAIENIGELAKIELQTEEGNQNTEHQD